MVEMVVLGISTAILMASAKLHVQIDEDKARRWKTKLEKVWDTGLMYAVTASKFAGRFSFCSIGVSSRSGRTYVRAFYAQANAPYESVSPWLAFAMKWWNCILTRGPPTAINVHCQRKMVGHGQVLRVSRD